MWKQKYTHSTHTQLVIGLRYNSKERIRLLFNWTETATLQSKYMLVKLLTKYSQ